jgi:hypothetical protein
MRLFPLSLLALALISAFLIGRATTESTKPLESQVAAQEKKPVAKVSEDGRPVAEVKGWQKGKGWGWIWGEGSRRAQRHDAGHHQVGIVAGQDRGSTTWVPYDRNSFKWPGHSRRDHFVSHARGVSA